MAIPQMNDDSSQSCTFSSTNSQVSSLGHVYKLYFPLQDKVKLSIFMDTALSANLHNVSASVQSPSLVTHCLIAKLNPQQKFIFMSCHVICQEVSKSRNLGQVHSFSSLLQFDKLLLSNQVCRHCQLEYYS